MGMSHGLQEHKTMQMTLYWHSMLTHSALALLNISALLFIVEAFVKKIPLQKELLTTARWNLCIGAAITAVAIIAGFFIQGTLKHSGLSLSAGAFHAKWEFITAAAFVLLAIWTLWKSHGERTANHLFTLTMFLTAGLLTVTSYGGN